MNFLFASPFRIKRLVLVFLSLSLFAFPHRATAAPKKIVLIAGVKSHGPEGNRIHDYPWSIRLLKTMLERSDIRDQVEVVTFFDGWPTDERELEDADTLMIVSDGRDGDRYSDAPHLATPEHVAFVDRLARRGCGLITFHFSTFAPDALSDPVLDWYGGYFDWETNGKHEWYSNITTLETGVAPASNRHPVLNGVAPFTMREEFYFDIRFRPDDPRWTPILRVEALPATKPNGNVVAWAVEREDGGRGFATTCGHYYDNWRNAGFRKTILNAIAWTAGIEVPAAGVEAPFVTRDEIRNHLAGTSMMMREEVSTADDTVYATRPYWYKPGHPMNPADASSIRTLAGFEVTRVFTVSPEFGSFTALAITPSGRLLAAAQHERGVYRITPPPTGGSESETTVERLGGAAEKMGWSHGLLHAFDSLYVTVSEENDIARSGVYRLRDTNGDGQYDVSNRLFELNAAGEHGPHNIVVGPDGRSLFLIGGNGTPLPDGVDRRRPVATTGPDHLMPPGFESSDYTAAGWVMRFDPDGGHRELIASGLRNSFDLAFNAAGDLFTFDSDMEWDLGMPWYRPTRICQLVSGAEFGWRGGAAKWPDYFEDGSAPVVNIGPASPTGVVFGHGTRFPGRYQNALFACDWTFGTIHAIHLEPHGAGYRAEIEEFVGGTGLPVTDIVVGLDGAMYFTVGGRRLGSAIYRIEYAGDEATENAPNATESRSAERKLHALRRDLESLHGRVDRASLDIAWPHLGHPDRAVRFAARVALETQPVSWWRKRALDERDPATQTTALLALARQGDPTDLEKVVDRLDDISWNDTTPDQKLRLLRVYELALARGGDDLAIVRPAVRQRLRPRFPDGDGRVNRELSRLLCFLGEASVIGPALDLMATDTGERPTLGSGYFVRNPKYGAAVRDMLESAPLVDRMHHAQMLLWLDDGWTPGQRRRYFKLIADAMAHSKGGHQYLELWKEIRETALDQIPEADREAFEEIKAPTLELAVGTPKPRGPGRDWTIDAVLDAVGKNTGRRDLANGHAMYLSAGCAVCHGMNGVVGAIGPDLSAIGRRFTLRDIVEAIIEPSRAISDQYRMTTLGLMDGTSVSGRIVARDSDNTRIATNLMRPSTSVSIPNASVRHVRSEPVSTMPPGLLNQLNEEELLDLLAYLTSVPATDRDSN